LEALKEKNINKDNNVKKSHLKGAIKAG